MVEIEIVEPVDIVLPDVVPDVPIYSNDIRYILDLEKLKTHEDVIRVLKHFSTRVVLDVLEVSGIEEYVKPYNNNQDIH